MATVTVTKKFKDDFDVWAEDRLRHNDFTPEDMAEFKSMLRRDMTPGPDQLREGLELINSAGVAVPAMIDSVDDRVKAWSDYFAACADEIRKRSRSAA